MHHRVDAVEQLGGKLADVPEHLPVEQGLGEEARASQAMTEIGGIKTDQLSVF